MYILRYIYKSLSIGPYVQFKDCPSASIVSYNLEYLDI